MLQKAPLNAPKKTTTVLFRQKKATYAKNTVKQVICTDFSNGKCYVLGSFKESKIRLADKIKALTDTGYRGL